jgi:lipoprotein-anchoring transpeptidase ErfK/SrfK
VGTLTARSRYSGKPITAWILRVSADRKFGLVPIAYSVPYRTGWIRLAGLRRESTPITVLVDLSQHRLTVKRLGRAIMRVPVATGSPSTPTPAGRYFVTERVPFSPGSSYGAFVFGISGIQTRLPCCGNLLAIHGTNNPSSIGRSVSAGCVRVGAAALQRLKPLLQLGTPVIIQV